MNPSSPLGSQECSHHQTCCVGALIKDGISSQEQFSRVAGTSVDHLELSRAKEENFLFLRY